MELKEILKTEVNSALVSFENHNADNGFFEDNVIDVEQELNERQYEPIGICKNVPFKSAGIKYSVAFVYKYKENVYWCHMPETYWFYLLKQYYGYDVADKIVDSIMQ